MTQASVSKIGTFDQDDLNKTIEKAKREVEGKSSLYKESKGDQILDTMPARDSIEMFTQQIKHEPIARQMRTVLEKFLGKQIHFNELTQAASLCVV
jgi:hypothetical protein